MKVMIAAGGTGGHIYPALALAERIQKKEPGTEIVFFGSDNRMEAKLIPCKGYRFYGFTMSGMNGGMAAKAASLFSLLKAEKYCRSILQKEKPSICIGFGNYISVPLIKAAHALKIPTMLHEQNSYAGKANRFLAKYADAIVGCYESSLEQFPIEKTKILGNPEAAQAADTVWDPHVLKTLGLDPKIPFIVFMMGSLGSSSVSKVIDEALPLLHSDFQVIAAAGRSNDYHFQYRSNERIKIVDYVDGKMMLKGCSLAVVRAGATTMAEICAIGTPSILIPSPYVPNNHQYYNAMELVNASAADIIEEKDLNAHILADTINALMLDKDARVTMHENAAKLGKADAADQIIDWIREIAE
ncbi:MAG: UDP-N-acetylglucosamine--N-acetylmuramyl-(pentapeptide) pyrophosphoryl-undecaprenol N-acetylglucosamine transferase [Erysipelotrichaceae bacterium]|jgi:UDP-N-acetylglucosamine--N-acetylmuramyl-(pentapeptide) pyrophosphoryl-undecaprenol N-acetylglucosamine transferase|nr:UDP-N-acetylglucosamine--N-acetylmuramyl-(pentapeptide) pyrophosphoryl-undecaprenol N-acetylglucosamine transferase [Erysipelotrichaceae bacterium]